MPSDAGMKPPKRKELNSPKIETELSTIQSLSREHDEENWESALAATYFPSANGYPTLEC